MDEGQCRQIADVIGVVMGQNNRRSESDFARLF